MNERPILFSGPMVRAILDNRKTQTRRVVKPQPKRKYQDGFDCALFSDELGEQEIRCPYGVPGDRLWVRETWAWSGDLNVPPFKRAKLGEVWYRADPERNNPVIRWRPSIFMPRWASRIDLEIERVRVERVQEISERDAKAEGVQLPVSEEGKRLIPISGTRVPKDWTFREFFALTWDELHAKHGLGWDANPWVWVIEFRRAEHGR